MNFAVHKIDPKDPKAASVKLNWYENGMGNSTVARIDSKDYPMGFEASGRWTGPAKEGGQFGGKTRTFDFSTSKTGIQVTQSVIIVPGDPPGGPGESKRPLNLCLAR